jgi:hypothetical protein
LRMSVDQGENPEVVVTVNGVQTHSIDVTEFRFWRKGNASAKEHLLWVRQDGEKRKGAPVIVLS